MATTTYLKKIVKRLPGMASVIHRRDRMKARQQVRNDYERFYALSQQQGRLKRFDLSWDPQWVCIDDQKKTTRYDRHYLYHIAWAARILAETQPTQHHDFSSLLYFAAALSAFVPIKQHEFRPAEIKIDNLICAKADLTSLPYRNGELESVSSMHVVEHLGLGRYGDPVAPDADLAAMAELTRVLAPGGQLIFAVPVGQPTIRFNGCRIYSYAQILDAFKDLHLTEFAMIPDPPQQRDIQSLFGTSQKTQTPESLDPGLIRHADPTDVAQQSYACGCFHFTRANTENRSPQP